MEWYMKAIASAQKSLVVLIFSTILLVLAGVQMAHAQEPAQEPNKGQAGQSTLTPEERKENQARQEQKEEEKGDFDDPRARAAYIERLHSGGRPVPHGARANALEQKRVMIENEPRLFKAQLAANHGKPTAAI